MTALGDLDRQRIRDLHARELARFREARPATLAMLERARSRMPNGTPMAWMASEYEQPVYVDRGEGPGFTDLDGFSYVDFNASDMAMFCGHANPGDRASRAGPGRAVDAVPAPHRGIRRTRLLRIWLANRGVWEALAGAGPTVPIPAVRGDVARYTEAYGDLLSQLTI
jgi:hypothetical protein